MSIEIQDLSFRYGKQYPIVLDGISLQIPARSVTVLLGLNGCGKTTLIKLMAGLLKPNSGGIRYDGLNLDQISYHERSRLFAYVPQRSAAIDDVLVEEYLVCGMSNEMRFYQLPKKEHYQKAHELSQRLHIEGLLKKKLGETSGGERQIISLCSALLQNSKAILLDEPLSALDLRNQGLVLSTLKEIAEEEGKTMVLSTHNPNHALFLDCGVALMENGRIKEYGPAKEVITLDHLKPIYGEKLVLSKALPYDEVSIAK